MNDLIESEILSGRPDPKAYVGRIGLVVLSTDEVGEDAFRSVIPTRDLHVSTTRTDYAKKGERDPASPHAFQLKTSYRAVLESLPPKGRLDLVAFSCTSATVEMGAAHFLDVLDEARPGLKYTTPGVAAFNALRAVGATRIALLTPYGLAMHKAFIPFFEQEGFVIVADATFGLESDAAIGELSRESLFDGARRLVGSRDVEALFVSCTATPIVPHIEELERELGLPVVSSSQAMAWDAMRLLGYRKPVDGFGRLLRLAR